MLGFYVRVLFYVFIFFVFDVFCFDVVFGIFFFLLFVLNWKFGILGLVVWRRIVCSGGGEFIFW